MEFDPEHLNLFKETRRAVLLYLFQSWNVYFSFTQLCWEFYLIANGCKEIIAPLFYCLSFLLHISYTADQQSPWLYCPAYYICIPHQTHLIQSFSLPDSVCQTMPSMSINLSSKTLSAGTHIHASLVIFSFFFLHKIQFGRPRKFTETKPFYTTYLF